MSRLIDVLRNGKRLTAALCLVLCATVLLSALPSVSSTYSAFAEESSVEDLTAEKEALAVRQEELAAQRDETVSSLEAQQQQAEIIRLQIEAKSDEIAINQALLDELQVAIDEKSVSIAEQETSIARLETEISNQQSTLRVRLREVSKKSSFATVVQLLLHSQTATDYLIGFKLSERLSTRNEKLMQELEQNIQSLEIAQNQTKNEKASLEVKHAQAAALQAELEAGKFELQTLYDDANALSEEMYKDVNYLNEQLAVMEQEQAYIQGTIDFMMEQIRQEEEQKRLEEEEKKRQEEEEKKRQEEEEQKREEESSSDESTEDSNYENDSNYEEDTDDSDYEDDSNYDDDSGYEDDSNYEEYPDDDESDYDDDSDSSVMSLMWPAPTCLVITSSFKYRDLDEEGQEARWHNGLDIACYGDAEGEPIVAAAAGKVRVSNRFDSYGGGYGYYMTIDHGYDSQGRRIITLYAHCSEVLVYEGQEVEAGEVIGYVGNTGNSFGAHLHFEVLVDFVAVDPVSEGYLPTDSIDILG